MHGVPNVFMLLKNTEVTMSKVYFTGDISPQGVIKAYETLGKRLDGRVAVKLHSGEKGNQNFLRPDFFEPIIKSVGGTVVECNTAYEGSRNTTKKHMQLIKDHGWSDYFDVDLLDAEGPDLVLDIPEGKIIKIGAPGKERYDVTLTPHSHFFCDVCGEVYDVFSPVSASDFDYAECETGGKISSASIAFRGVCKRCLDNKKQ